MRRFVTIPITPAILVQAQREMCYGCAVALALRAATGQTWWVGATDAVNEGTKQRWRLPETVRGLIRLFDAGELRPCTFPLPGQFGTKGA